MMFALPTRGVASKSACTAKSCPQTRPVLARRLTTTRAQSEKSGLEKLSDGMGMPTDDGFFGFTPFAEQWVGRWAMLGFASSVVGEFVTGNGALGQIGIETPSAPVLAVLLTIAGGATAVATIATGKKALDNKMSKSEISRYKSFLGLNSQVLAEEEALRMKLRGDFTTPGVNMKAVEQTKAAGSPVDGFLGTNEVAQGEAAATAMKASTSTPEQVSPQKKEAQDEMYPGERNDVAFAQSVEITNGRWAMLGFLASIVVEAASGSGILGQVVFYLKASGVLGDKSGF